MIRHRAAERPLGVGVTRRAGDPYPQRTAESGGRDIEPRPVASLKLTES